MCSPGRGQLVDQFLQVGLDAAAARRKVVGDQQDPGHRGQAIRDSQRRQRASTSARSAPSVVAHGGRRGRGGRARRPARTARRSAGGPVPVGDEPAEPPRPVVGERAGRRPRCPDRRRSAAARARRPPRPGSGAAGRADEVGDALGQPARRVGRRVGARRRSERARGATRFATTASLIAAAPGREDDPLGRWSRLRCRSRRPPSARELARRCAVATTTMSRGQSAPQNAVTAAAASSSWRRHPVEQRSPSCAPPRPISATVRPSRSVSVREAAAVAAGDDAGGATDRQSASGRPTKQRRPESARAELGQRRTPTAGAQ